MRGATGELAFRDHVSCRDPIALRIRPWYDADGAGDDHDEATRPCLLQNQRLRVSKK